MKKKEIAILIIVFLVIMLVSALLVYLLFNKNPNKQTKQSNVLNVESYTLNYGKYKGFEEEYDYDTDKTVKKELVITLTKDKINNEFYQIKGTSLFVNNFEMYKVIANNKIILLAGEGVELEYEGK